MHFKTGDIFHSKYIIERQLGRGGAGVVYQAKHKRLAKSVAIKILSSEGAADEQSRARFEREAMATAGLQSTHIVRVYDVDVTAEGLPFIVMELLEGRDLGSYLRQEDLSVSRSVDIGIQVCSALAEAHAAGIIHRDIKPSNIFISGPEQIAKVVDFGVSKVLSAEELTTHNMSFIGTPRYMPPEQLKGGTVDARADIWATGVMLYRLLTKQFPIEVDEHAESIVKAVATLSTEPTHISKFRPDLPQGLQDAIMWTLKKNLEDRCPSAETLASALMPFGSGTIHFEAPGSGASSGFRNTNARSGSDVITPVGFGSTSNGLTAAELRAEDDDSGSRKGLVIGAAVLTAIAIAAGTFFLLKPAHKPLEQETAVKIDSPPTVPSPPAVSAAAVAAMAPPEVSSKPDAGGAQAQATQTGLPSGRPTNGGKTGVRAGATESSATTAPPRTTTTSAPPPTNLPQNPNRAATVL